MDVLIVEADREVVALMGRLVTVSAVRMIATHLIMTRPWEEMLVKALVTHLMKVNQMKGSLMYLVKLLADQTVRFSAIQSTFVWCWPVLSLY